jgi:hypothetical protein
MERIGLRSGDRMRVSTRRGAIELKARIDGAIPPGLIFIPFAYAEAAANVLTNPQLDPFGKIPEFKFCAAEDRAGARSGRRRSSLTSPTWPAWGPAIRTLRSCAFGRDGGGARPHDTERRMKICIYGAGAIGGYMGVCLKQAGLDVSLIARGAHLEAIRRDGLKLLIGGDERVAQMPATADPAELGPQDYVIVGPEVASGLGSGRADAPALWAEHRDRHGAERHSVVVILRVRGPVREPATQSVDPDGLSGGASARSAPSPARSTRRRRSASRASSSTLRRPLRGSASRRARSTDRPHAAGGQVFEKGGP